MKLVIQNTSRVWGGNEKWLLTLAQGLRARGHQVMVSCRRHRPLERALAERGLSYTGIRPGSYGDVLRGLRFLRGLRRERPDAVLLTSWKGIPWGSWAARRAGVARVVVRLGIVRALPARGRHVRPFRRVDALIVNSAEIRETWLRSAPWFPAERVHLVLNGVPPADPLAPAERRSLRAGLRVPDQGLLVMGVGHLQPRKGFGLLLEAFARARLPDATLAIVGAGPEADALRRRAEALGVGDRVRWPGHRADAPRLLAAADLFVLSSRNEGMANVMLEAMAAGTPVVATDVSGVRAALAADRDRPAAGRIVPADDLAEMASALREVADGLRRGDPEVAARVAEARWRSGHWFGTERMIDEAEAVLLGTAV